MCHLLLKMKNGENKLKLFENENGVIEEMSSKLNPLTLFNVYCNRKDKTRCNARVIDHRPHLESQ